MSNDLHQMIGRIDERTELMMKSMEEFKGAVHNHSVQIASIRNEIDNDKAKAKGVLLGISLGSGTLGALLAKILPFTGH